LVKIIAAAASTVTSHCILLTLLHAQQ